MPHIGNKSARSAEAISFIHYKERLLTPKQQYTAETNITAVRIMRQVTKKPIISLELQTTKILDVIIHLLQYLSRCDSQSVWCLTS